MHLVLNRFPRLRATTAFAFVFVLALTLPLAAGGSHDMCNRCFCDGFLVKPFEFDPGGTKLVASEWIRGTGCPTNASTYDGTMNTPYTDPACLVGDPKDKWVEGLLLAKTGPTANFASSGAELKGVRGTRLHELGYDIRKATYFGAEGSHCGAGAPRFNISYPDGSLVFIGCVSPPANTFTTGAGFVRLTWGGGAPLIAFKQAATCPDGAVDLGATCDITGVAVDAIDILFDEGQDTPPDLFGAAFIDNVNVNGLRVGRHGDRDHRDSDKDGHDDEADWDDDNDGYQDSMDADDDNDGIEDSWDGKSTEEDQTSYSMVLSRGEAAEFPLAADADAVTVTAVLENGKVVMDLVSPLGAIVATSIPSLGRVVLTAPAVAGDYLVRVRNLSLTDVSSGLKLIQSKRR